jgi:hypothetical protein
MFLILPIGAHILVLKNIAFSILYFGPLGQNFLEFGFLHLVW